MRHVLGNEYWHCHSSLLSQSICLNIITSPGNVADAAAAASGSKVNMEFMLFEDLFVLLLVSGPVLL